MYRKLTEQDLEHLKSEISKDPTHCAIPNFYEEFIDPRGVSLVFEDNDGSVMYVTFRREIRATIQFCDVDKQRIRNIFQIHLEEFAINFKKVGYIAMNYVTANLGLAWFLRKFGFKKQEVQRKAL
jgi:hypothetical protein